MNRISHTNQLIDNNGLSGKMNNTKWRELFELLESFTCAFRIKLLSDSEESIQNSWNKTIFELEESELLIDNYEDYGFIQFKEIERIDIKCSNNLESLWNGIKLVSINAEQIENLVSIYGY